MTNERELKEKIEEKREESPYKCSLCDRAFSDRAEYEAIRIVCIRKSSRFEHFFIGFLIRLLTWK
jgi:transposase-like protein